ncbi:MAG: hypothetical protein HZB56_09260 [Deltaproteobacteria bacterium]|nr:hypothetical protein [Deltaproteobacteria bacterium]
MRPPGRLLLLALAAAAPACRSSAPYTVPSALLNSAIAVGAAAHQRAEGGCYATCTAGMACNPKNGYCEPVPLCGTCRPGEACTQTEAGWRCASPGTPVIDLERGPPPAAPGSALPGVSPATGKPPPPPAEQRPGTP